MNKNIKKFIEEFSNSFSDLLVESFIIRYLEHFDRKELFEVFKLTNKKINEKTYEKIVKKKFKTP